MNDISSTEDIKELVDKFYTQVLVDPQIGFIFTGVVKISIEHHMPIMYSFWGSLLLGTATYSGNPMLKHVDLNRKFPLTKDHFERWLELWEETVHANFEGPIAVQAVERAKNIAGLMQYKIEQDS